MRKLVLLIALALAALFLALVCTESNTVELAVEKDGTGGGTVTGIR